MIMFTRLNRSTVAINPDLIERVEANPDTVITLTDDKKVLVVESIQQVIDLITDYRAYVIARSRTLEVVHEPHPTLHLVPTETAVGRREADGTGRGAPEGDGRSSEGSSSEGWSSEGTVIDGARVFNHETRDR